MMRIIFLFLIIIIYILINKRENFTSKSILHNYFDSIYVITLPKRRQYIENIMLKMQIFPTYFNAINKDLIDRNKLINEGFIHKNYKNSNGRIACHNSHINVLKQFLKTKNNSCFIFEDDIKGLDMSKTSFNEIVSESIKQLPTSYDIIYFGRCWDTCSKQIQITKNLVKAYKPQCRHAYGVSRKGAKKIIKLSLPMIKWGGDTIIAKLIQNGIIEAYAITPQIFKQNRTELGTNLGNNDALLECSR